MIMATMDPNDIPADFEQHNFDERQRSRESILFEEDMQAAIAASRAGFERTMSVVEPAPEAGSAREGTFVAEQRLIEATLASNA